MNDNEKGIFKIDENDQREILIREIDKNQYKNNLAFQVVLNKYGLTPYLYEQETIDPIFENYKNIAKSKVNEFVLHPYQYKVLQLLESGENLIVSAPTSFGKTASIFEYIARNKKKINKIVIIVPTLALRNEYLEKINNCLDKHIILTNCSDTNQYDQYCMILTHERFVEYFSKAEKSQFNIDLLVIDEIYKLQNENNTERMYSMSLAYLSALKIAKQYVFLGPFIKKIDIPDVKEYKELKYDYSPIAVDLFYEGTKNINYETLSKSINDNEKTLIYFSSKNELLSTIDDFSKNIDIDDKNKELIKYIEDEYGKEWIDEWNVISALKKGIGIHYNELPSFIKEYVINSYNNSDETMILFATSTLLEGVNTSTKRLIITSKKIGTKDLSGFEFWNLVGRAGRLGKYKVGEVVYYGNKNDYNKDDKYINLDNLWINMDCNKDEYEIINNEQLTDTNKQQKLDEIMHTYGMTYDEIKYIYLPFMLKVDNIIKFFETTYNALISEIKKIISENKNDYEPSNKIRESIFNLYIKEYKKPVSYGALPTSQFQILSYGINLINTTRNDKIKFIVKKGRDFLFKYSKDDSLFEQKLNNLYNYSFYMVNNYIENVYVPGILLLKNIFDKNKPFSEQEYTILQNRIFKQVEKYSSMVNEDDIFETLGIISPLAKIIKEICGDKIDNISELKEQLNNKREIVFNRINSNELYKYYFRLLINKLKI
ncbi:MAG: DEAD/DEAH box helicase [Bacilli bacterium]|nr:DEAD/DEAH box helicase [Bacilli bacterium]